MTRLRAASVIAPALFVGVVIQLTVVLVDQVHPALLIAIAVLIVTAAAGLFSGIVFRVIEQSEVGLHERNRQLAALQSATLSLAPSAARLPELLQRFVDLSRAITGARYGAMSVLRPDGRIAQFITSGITAEERAALGDPPTGHGVLGLILEEGRTLRLDDITSHPRSVGFPPGHPAMKTLLGVPVVSRGTVIGNLYLTDKEDGTSFTDADEEMVRAFAAHAAVAVETSRLQEQLRSLAVLQERERIGMDLHDGIIQALYAVALRLEAVVEDIERAPAEAARAVDGAIEDLNAVIRDVRNYIFDLRPAHMASDLGTAIRSLGEEFRINSLIETRVEVDDELGHLSDEQQLALFHIAQEALSNTRRHARATQASIALHREDGRVSLRISDNGAGFDPQAHIDGSHRGLRNIIARASSVGAQAEIASAPGQGTRITVSVPVDGARTEAS